MCHIIFKHMHNLRGFGHVEKYIHPALMQRYHDLQSLASILHEEEGVSTRIDYSNNGLCLLSKPKDRWSLVDVNKVESNERLTFHDTTTVTGIPSRGPVQLTDVIPINNLHQSSPTLDGPENSDTLELLYDENIPQWSYYRH